MAEINLSSVFLFRRFLLLTLLSRCLVAYVRKSGDCQPHLQLKETEVKVRVSLKEMVCLGKEIEMMKGKCLL